MPCIARSEPHQVGWPSPEQDKHSLELHPLLTLIWRGVVEAAQLDQRQDHVTWLFLNLQIRRSQVSPAMGPAVGKIKSERGTIPVARATLPAFDRIRQVGIG